MSAFLLGLLQRRYAYLLFVFVLLSLWFAVMTANDLWYLLRSFWEMPVTMVFGSFVAGFTATGGSAVAFPVFTKVLEMPSADARMFGLMIQSFGMTAASVYIWSRRIPVLKGPVKWAILGGVSGMLLSIAFLSLSGSSVKLLFTALSSLFALLLIWTHWIAKPQARKWIAVWGPRQATHFFIAGLVGGMLTENTGSGVDMMVFALLTLVYRIDAQISIPTSVITMAVTSIFGFATHGLLTQDIGPVWDYWLICIPVVIFGAPLGAMMLTRISQTQIVVFLCLLIAVEFVSTILLVPIEPKTLGMVLPVSAGTTLLLAIAAMDQWIAGRREVSGRQEFR